MYSCVDSLWVVHVAGSERSTREQISGTVIWAIAGRDRACLLLNTVKYEQLLDPGKPVAQETNLMILG